MQYVVGLGSNLGSRHALIEAGLALLEARTACRIERVSPYYESDPVGPPQPSYLNSAARIESPLSPSALLAGLHAVEACFGRTRNPRLRFGPRTLDLDILWASAASAASAPDDGAAEVPHPRLEQRWFCLRPLLNVAPELEAEYGPKLLQLPPEALEVRPRPTALIHNDAASFDIRCEATDRAEALACALTALARALGPSTAASPAAPLRVAGECSRGSETACCAAAVASMMQHRAALHSVAVTELVAGRYSAYLTLAPTQQTPNGLVVTLEAIDVNERAVAIRAETTRGRTSHL